jgi:hypothetical protein
MRIIAEPESTKFWSDRVAQLESDAAAAERNQAIATNRLHQTIAKSGDVPADHPYRAKVDAETAAVDDAVGALAVAREQFEKAKSAAAQKVEYERGEALRNKSAERKKIEAKLAKQGNLLSKTLAEWEAKSHEMRQHGDTQLRGDLNDRGNAIATWIAGIVLENVPHAARPLAQCLENPTATKSRVTGKSLLDLAVDPVPAFEKRNPNSVLPF